MSEQPLPPVNITGGPVVHVIVTPRTEVPVVVTPKERVTATEFATLTEQVEALTARVAVLEAGP